LQTKSGNICALHIDARCNEEIRRQTKSGDADKKQEPVQAPAVFKI
jgi:hypothetical protein